MAGRYSNEGSVGALQLRNTIGRQVAIDVIQGVLYVGGDGFLILLQVAHQ